MEVVLGKQLLEFSFLFCEKLRIYNTYSMPGSCCLAYTATRPQGSATRARDCMSHIALPAMLYLLHNMQACSQTFEKGGASNYYEQGLILTFLESNSMQSISNRKNF